MVQKENMLCTVLRILVNLGLFHFSKFHKSEQKVRKWKKVRPILCRRLADKEGNAGFQMRGDCADIEGMLVYMQVLVCGE